MKRLGFLFPVLILVLSVSFPVSVEALDLVGSQKEMKLVIEQGGSAKFMLILLNTESDDVLFPYGDIDDWISFGEGNLAIYECDSRGIDWVKITIDVPRDTEVGEYEGGITTSDGHTKITVKVVPPLDEIKSLQDLEEMKAGLEEVKKSITQELGNTKDELQGKIAEISQYQRDLAVLEAELEEVREKSQNLEEANAELTGQLSGQLVGGSSTQVIIGIIVGIIIVAIFLNRRGITKALRKTRKAGPPGGEERYKGWKPS